MKKLPPAEILSLIIRTTFFLTFATFLGTQTYDKLDTIITSTLLFFTALTLYFPPIYNFFNLPQPTNIIHHLHKPNKQSIPTLISLSIFIITIIILKTL